MCGFHFIVPTSNVLLISAAAVVLGQGHGKVTFPQTYTSLSQIFMVTTAQMVSTWEPEDAAAHGIDPFLPEISISAPGP